MRFLGTGGEGGFALLAGGRFLAIFRAAFFAEACLAFLAGMRVSPLCNRPGIEADGMEAEKMPRCVPDDDNEEPRE